MGRVRLDVLGALVVSDDGGAIPLNGDRRRTLMAALALRRGVHCSAAWLADVVWRASPPAGASATLHSHISILRRLLDPEPQQGVQSIIRTVPDGYVLDTTEVDVDADRFIAALLDARRTSDPVSRLGYVQDALDLWRGTPFAEHADLEQFQGEVARLEILAAEALTLRLATLARYSGATPM